MRARVNDDRILKPGKSMGKYCIEPKTMIIKIQYFR